MTLQDWHHDYFSEPYGEAYENYLLPPEVAEKEAIFVREVLGLDGDAVILDCPCGYGRHFQFLREEFDQVIGIDLSADCLGRAAGAILDPLLARGDMRRLPFGGGRFDGVVNLFNSFGYFGPEGDLGVLREFARVLRPGGRLLIDVANLGSLIEIIEENPRTQVQVADLMLTEDWRYDPATGMLHNDTLMEFPEQSVSRSYDLRLYTLSEIEELFSQSGFNLIEAFGEFDGQAYDEADSDRMIVVAEKSGKG